MEIVTLYSQILFPKNNWIYKTRSRKPERDNNPSSVKNCEVTSSLRIGVFFVIKALKFLGEFFPSVTMTNVDTNEICQSCSKEDESVL